MWWQQHRSGTVCCCMQSKQWRRWQTFIRDRALKECPLCRSQYGCWSAASIETSVYCVIYMHIECSWTWWLYSECSLIMWEHLKHYFCCQEVEPTVMWMGQPHARNQNQGTLTCGRQRSSMFEGCSCGSFITPGRGSVVMADIQHNVWVTLLSW